jgi:hypothetical protein
MSINQDARRVAFGHRDGRVDCYSFTIPAIDPSSADDRALAVDGQPAGVVALTEDVLLSRPRGRVRLSVVHISALNDGEQSMLLCGYTNGKVEMVTNSTTRRSDQGDTAAVEVQTKSFSLEEGSSVVWVRAQQDQILCACRSLVALASESLHILVRRNASRCTAR